MMLPITSAVADTRLSPAACSWPPGDTGCAWPPGALVPAVVDMKTLLTDVRNRAGFPARRPDLRSYYQRGSDRAPQRRTAADPPIDKVYSGLACGG